MVRCWGGSEGSDECVPGEEGWESGKGVEECGGERKRDGGS